MVHSKGRFDCHLGEDHKTSGRSDACKKQGIDIQNGIIIYLNICIALILMVEKGKSYVVCSYQSLVDKYTFKYDNVVHGVQQLRTKNIF